MQTTTLAHVHASHGAAIISPPVGAPEALELVRSKMAVALML